MQAADAKFIPGNEHCVLSRDYLSVKLWDIRTASCNTSPSSMLVDQGKTAQVAPVWSAQVTDYMEKNLADLYGSGQTEDLFQLSVSPDGKYFATGGYNKSCHIMDVNATMNQAILCKYGQRRDSSVGSLKVYNKKKRLVASNSATSGASGSRDVSGNNTGGASSSLKNIDFNKRVSMQTWAPAQCGFSHLLAQVFRNCIYIYYSGDKKRTPVKVSC